MITTGARVLIVDDDADLAESLGRDPDRPWSATSASPSMDREAVERACAQDFDIIFMDVRMPVMNGRRQLLRDPVDQAAGAASS